MRKEYFIVVVSGLIIGIIFAFGVWRINKSLKPEPQNLTSEEVSPPPPDTSVQEVKTTLISPQESEVITTSPLSLKGVTSRNSWVVVLGEEKDLIVKSDTNGEFELEIPLVAGINQILINSFVENGKESKILRTVVFSSEFLKEIENIKSTNFQESTNSGESTNSALKKELLQLQTKPKAYIGTVTDKSSNSLQLKNNLGEIKLVSINPYTSFARVTKSSTKITFDDVAIGDFVVAMGLLTPNGATPEKNHDVLNSIRILVTDPPKEVKREAIIGKISSIGKNEIILKEGETGQRKLEFPKRWDGPNLNELSEGDTLLAAGEKKEETLLIRTIYLVPTQSPTP